MLVAAALFASADAAQPSERVGAASEVAPHLSAGSFYPSTLPSDTDNDLTAVTGSAQRAAGTLLLLEGRILDAAGREVPDARIEIWHADAEGRYPTAGGAADTNFQGYGRTETGADGRWRFRTIKPGSSPGRAAHIHVRVAAPGFGSVTTQIYFEGEPANVTDPVLSAVSDPAARASLLVSLSGADEAEPGVVSGRLDIVLAFNAKAPV